MILFPAVCGQLCDWTYSQFSKISADLSSSILMIQDKDWNGEDSDEDESADNLEGSDEDDSYYSKKPKGRLLGKGGRNVRSTKEHTSYRASSRQRMVKLSFEEDEPSAEDSDSDSDENFKSLTRRGANLRKNGGRSTVSANITGRNSEVRTSSRSVRKVSYVESEESEEVDEGKKKKPQKVQSTYFSVESMSLSNIYMQFSLQFFLCTPIPTLILLWV